MRASTVSELASLVGQDGVAPPWPSLVALRTHGTRPPLFCIHGARGNILKFRELAHLLGADQPVYALQTQGLDGVQAPYTRIEEMAAHYLREIEAVAPEGPEFLCGHCMGGLIALEMAQRLRATGRRVALVALLDTGFVSVPGLDTAAQGIAYHRRRFREYGLRSALKSAYDGARHLIPETVRDRMRPALRRLRRRDPGPDVSAIMRRIEDCNFQAALKYRPRAYPGRIVFYLANEGEWCYRYDALWGWRHLAAGGLGIEVVPGDHDSVLSGPSELAADLRAKMDEIIETSLMSHDAAVSHLERVVGGASEGQA